ncbi:hypothetical protein AMTRI_Chr01g132640 [Amborella trichopoda]
MDNYRVIFGLELLMMVKAAVVPHLGVVTILAEFCPCMDSFKGKGKGKILFALQEYADVMPLKVPKSLPPWRAVDHQIELQASDQPPDSCPISDGCIRVGWSIEATK